MEYFIKNFEIKTGLDENAIDNIISEAEEWLEPYESIGYRKSGTTIIVTAFNMTSGDSRDLIEIDVNDHVYADLYE